MKKLKKLLYNFNLNFFFLHFKILNYFIVNYLYYKKYKVIKLITNISLNYFYIFSLIKRFFINYKYLLLKSFEKYTVLLILYLILII